MNNLQASLGSAPLLGSSGHTYTYESATGRMKKVTDGTYTATYSYLPNSDWLATTIITRLGVSGDALTQTRTPDVAGRLRSVVTTRGGTLLESHTWRYNAAKLRDRDTLADGSYWDYSYGNGRGEITEAAMRIADGSPIVGHAFGYGYDPAGNRRSTTVNGRPASYTANALNQYTQRNVPGFLDVSGSANIDAVVKIRGPQGTRAAQRQGALFQGTLPVDNRAGPVDAEIEVEAMKVAPNPPYGAVTSTVNGKLYLPQHPEIFSHDEDGNLTADGRWNYTWDAENRLIKMETLPAAVSANAAHLRLEFAYDWLNRRIQKKVSTFINNSWQLSSQTKFIYDEGWNLLAEIDGQTNSLKNSYLWGLDLSGSRQGAGGIGGLLVENLSGSAFLPFYDGIGNILGIVQATNGLEAARYSYSPFGEQLQATGAMVSENPFRLSTRYQDIYTDLVYYGYF